MNPLSTEALAEMREIVAGIESGKYKHLQDTWHCGTAHCFAGWKCVNDGEKLGFDSSLKFQTTSDVTRDPVRLELAKLLGMPEIPGWALEPYWGQYAADAWGLTSAEQDYLFHQDRTVSALHAAVCLLEQGKRYTDVDAFSLDVRREI